MVDVVWLKCAWDFEGFVARGFVEERQFEMF